VAKLEAKAVLDKLSKFKTEIGHNSVLESVLLVLWITLVSQGHPS
jgi:hypothetical protein